MATRKSRVNKPSVKGKTPSGRPMTATEPRIYDHPEARTLLRPDVGTQASFRKKKPPQTYRYDSSLSPALTWDGQNASRELGEWLIGLVEEASRLEAPHEFTEPRRTTLGRRTFGAANIAASRRRMKDKVIDDRGNELLVVKNIAEAEA